MPLREIVQEMVEEGQELNPEEFHKLLLDEMQVEKLTEDDKKFLEEFKDLDVLCMNQTSLRSCANFPDSPNLKRLELNENYL